MSRDPLQTYTAGDIEGLAFVLRSNPTWMREEIIREWIAQDELRTARKAIIDAVDPKLVKLLSLTVEPLKETK